MNIYRVLKEFKNEAECHDYLIRMRWPDGVSCRFCQSKKVYRRKNGVRFKCGNCNKSFSATSGTIFHATRIPLTKWFLGMAEILAAKKGISSLQLARSIGVNKNTAWYMQMRIRRAMNEDLILKGLIDLAWDDSSLAPNSPNKTYMKHRRQGVHKPLMVDMVLSLKSPPLKSGILGSPEKKAENSHPNFLSMVKRAMIGQYHMLSTHQLCNYIDEIIFKYINKNNNMFYNLIYRMVYDRVPNNGKWPVPIKELVPFTQNTPTKCPTSQKSNN